MPITPATILIPDISGFTNFMNTTELEHGSHIISTFLETIVQQVDESFEISEIEGDAVLMYKKGGVTTKQEILDLCKKMFEAFHYQRKMIQQVVLCPCGVCQSLINLSLKFIAHHGTISEIRVNKFVKASGIDMIIAHRLLKNSIHSDEYVLLTNNFLEKVSDESEPGGFVWKQSSDEFPAIGNVGYRYALLDKLKSEIPDPPPSKESVTILPDETAYVEEHIAAPMTEVYLAYIDMANRIHWMNSLKKVEQADDHVYVGSIHTLYFDDLKTITSPTRVSIQDQEIIYAESSTAVDLNVTLLFECRFRLEGDGCLIAGRISIPEGSQIGMRFYTLLFENLKSSYKRFKAYCENGFKPVEAVVENKIQA